MAPLCVKCSGQITDRYHIVCKVCEHVYHSNCMKMSNKRFDLLSPQRKTDYICLSCKNSPDSDIYFNTPLTRNRTSSPHHSQDYVTIRKKTSAVNIHTENSFEGLPEEDEDGSSDSSSSQTCKQKTNRSYTVLRLNKSYVIDELNDKIDRLTIQLKSSEMEIDKLLQANCSLSKQVRDYDLRVKQLTSICKSTKVLPKSTKSKSSSKTRRKLVSRTKLDFTMEPNVDESTPTLQVEPLSPTAETVPERGIATAPTTKSLAKQKQLQSPQDAYTNKIPKTTNSPIAARNRQSPKIFVFGGQQCAGMGPMLLQLQKDTNIVKYDVSAFIKPGASTERILETVKNHKFRICDKIILSVGEHDSNPIEIFSHLHNVLRMVTNTPIYILSLRINKNIDVTNLNYMLRHSCYNEDNLSYIDVASTQTKSINKKKYLRHMCMKLNLRIDQIDYKNAYYSYNCVNNSMSESLPHTTESVKIALDDCQVSPHSSTEVQNSPINVTTPYFFRT